MTTVDQWGSDPIRDASDILGGITAIPDADRQRARLTVAEHARDADDARHILRALGLIE